MKVTATFEVYYTTNDTIKISEEVNPTDFDDDDEIYDYIRGQAIKKARKAGYYNYDEPEIDCPSEEFRYGYGITSYDLIEE